jgi:hypothetical protein
METDQYTIGKTPANMEQMLDKKSTKNSRKKLVKEY